MIPRRNALLGLLAWLLVVVLVSAVAWLAIDRAGRQVLEPASLPRAAAAVAPTPEQDPNLRRTSSPRGGTSRSAKKPGSPTPGPGATGSARPGTTRRADPVPTPTPTPKASSEQARRTRTVTVPGGRVAVTCERSRISLLYATPQDGWQVEVGDDGPETVEVHFRQRSGGEGESELFARCVDGAPRVSTEDHESGEHG